MWKYKNLFMDINKFFLRDILNIHVYGKMLPISKNIKIVLMKSYYYDIGGE